MKRITGILSVLTFTGLLLMCCFAWFSADDICYRNELQHNGVLEKAWFQYLHWDGRSLGIASLIQLFCLKYIPAPFIALIWTTGFVGIAFMILKIVMLEKTGHSGYRPSLRELALLVSIMWLGMWKLIPDILYWATGGWYTPMCLLGLIWLYVFIKGLRTGNYGTGKNIFILVISALCGVNSHNLVVSLLLIVLIELAVGIVQSKDKKAIRYCLFAATGIVAGGAFVLVAPGNFVRLSAVNWTGFNAMFLYHCIIVFARYCYWLPALILVLLYFYWLNGNDVWRLPASLSGSLKKSRSSFNSMKSFIALMAAQKYLIAALATILVFSATSFFAVPRTALFFAVYLILYVLQKFNLGLRQNETAKFISGSSLFLFLVLSIIAIQLYEVNNLHQTLQQREKKYDMHQGEDVVVDAIPKKSIPFAYEFVDISSDSAYWVNRCVALNYGLKTVRTNE